jgi:hypothetical protein
MISIIRKAYTAITHRQKPLAIVCVAVFVGLAGAVAGQASAREKAEVAALSNDQLSAAGPAPSIFLTAREQAFLRAHPTIRLGYLEDYPPYLMTDENGRQSGIFADLRNALTQTLGVEIVIEEFKTFTDLLKASENKTIDAVTAIMPQRSRKRGLLPTEVFLHSYAAVYTRDG